VKPVLSVVQPGLLTTIQDLGRPGAIAGGVPPGGAMDRFAHRAANLLVGNAAGDATLECTLSGPTLDVEADSAIAITGADLSPAVNGEPAPMWTSVALRAGDRVSFAGRRGGAARAYVAVAGGFDGDRWLGSRATYLLAARGGMHGRPISDGDVLEVATERGATLGRSLDPSLRPDYSERVLHAMAGPHVRRLDAEGRAALFGETWSLSTASDRMGARLTGPILATSGEEVLSFGLVAGAIQLPRSGQPILLLVDHQTAGGYPVVATVVSSSMPIAGQLVPGDKVRFDVVTAAQARAGRQRLTEALASLAAP
jgi:antagonist of KipI